MFHLPGTEPYVLNHSSLVPRCLTGNGDALPAVLYLDDDWEHLSTQCAMLESAGYRVEATDSPAAGLSSYIRNAFDAVVLDFHLPFVSNGLLATVMHQFRRDIPLILVSDRAEFADNELGTLDRLLPRDTSQGIFLENVYEVIERGHDVYAVIERRDQSPADQDRKIVDCSDREDRI